MKLRISLICFIFIALQPCIAFAEPDQAQDRILKSINWANVYQMKSKTLAQYFQNPEKSSENLKAFDADFENFLSTAEKLNVYSDLPGFRVWWNKNKALYLKSETLGKVKTLPLSGFVTMTYLNFAADKANKLDRSDPLTKQKQAQGALTAGSDYFAKAYDQVSNHPLSSILGTAAAGAFTYVGGKVVYMFILGPGINVVNSISEPVVRPALERINVLRSQHIDPWFVPWSQFVSGEKGKRKRANEAKTSGKVMTGELARYDHPAISVEDFTRDNEAFFDEMMKADYKWRGWLNPEFGKARNTGFELLFTQWQLLSEKLNIYQTAINSTESVLSGVKLELLNAGAQEGEIENFSNLVKQIQDVRVYEDVRSPKLKELELSIQVTLKNWLDRGIDKAKIEQFYDHLLQLTIAKNRPAFALGAFLYNEMYYQEFNTAISEYKKIQAGQEQAREMSGFYEELRKNEVNIQKFFNKKGLKYNVMDRINQRGYPLGGPRRPVNVPPVGDCIRDFIRVKAIGPK